MYNLFSLAARRKIPNYNCILKNIFKIEFKTYLYRLLLIRQDLACFMELI